jgi:hypothetical protein
MVSMNKILVIIALSLCAWLAHAEIQVQIEPTPVTMNDSFQLTLIQEGSQGTGVPNLSVLQKDFLIVGTARQVSYAVINGQSSMSNQWVITLKPLKSGVLSIPAIKIGSEQSTPMTINVEASSTTQETPDLDENALVLKTSVDLAHPYVNQQIIYTVKLYNSKRLIDANYEAPQAEDALIIPLGDAKRYQAMHNNTNYVVEEQRYAVFPQKSGILKIISPSFTALVYEFNPQRLKVQDKERDIQVQPIPQPYSGGLWLPAKEVTLSERYENLNQNLNQGSTLVRTIALEGVGIPAQLLPNLSFQGADEFSVYPEKGTDRNQVRQGELIGATEFKVTYLFNKAGKVILPEVRVPWFNTQTGKEEVAILAPRSINITASPNSINTTQKTAATADKVMVNEENQTTTAISESTAAKANSFWPWLMACLFGCAWLITLLLWGWQKRSRLMGKGQYKAALEQLKKACADSNPLEARDALLKWATVHWPDATILNLGELAQLIHDPQLKKQVHILSQVLYKNKENMLWRGDELLRAVQAVQHSAVIKRRKSDLPPINPN